MWVIVGQSKFCVIHLFARVLTLATNSRHHSQSALRSLTGMYDIKDVKAEIHSLERWRRDLFHQIKSACDYTVNINRLTLLNQSSNSHNVVRLNQVPPFSQKFTFFKYSYTRKFTLKWSDLFTQTKQVNTKYSSIQIHVNKASKLFYSHPVWVHSNKVHNSKSHDVWLTLRSVRITVAAVIGLDAGHRRDTGAADEAEGSQTGSWQAGEAGGTETRLAWFENQTLGGGFWTSLSWPLLFSWG